MDVGIELLLRNTQVSQGTMDMPVDAPAEQHFFATIHWSRKLLRAVEECRRRKGQPNQFFGLGRLAAV